jgi:hypothetical protein
MAFYQASALNSSLDQAVRSSTGEEQTTSIQYDRTYLLDALNKGKLVLSVSPLLGCDYVFVKHDANEMLLDSDNIQRTFNNVLRLLTVTPKQTIFIAVTDTIDGQLQFTRHDFAWNNQNVESITKIDITQSEQIDFIEMIYNCSSPI